jgi:PhnB protein
MDKPNVAQFRRDGWPLVVPRIVVDDPAALAAFVKQVFNARGDLHPERPVELWIGESVIMISKTGVRSAMPAFLYVYVPDTDATYRSALAAGARSLEAPLDTPYGDRRCMVADAWNNIWQIATRQS